MESAEHRASPQSLCTTVCSREAKPRRDTYTPILKEAKGATLNLNWYWRFGVCQTHRRRKVTPSIVAASGRAAREVDADERGECRDGRRGLCATRGTLRAPIAQSVCSSARASVDVKNSVHIVHEYQ